ncbi:MAG: mannose-6-phosphate isomerase, class I [Treponema sp.]|nr:mannose-6-phosphate isomerase, class I [Treponema sp.]
MSKIFALVNKYKHYEWGSKSVIPEFIGFENKTSMPYAEMWMGTHKGAPSRVSINASGDLADLSEVSGDLPFLFKLLAIEHPLSVQAHPNLKQAREGFKKEQSSGLSINAPTRNYKDTNHKPEIICSITPVYLMAGFRELDNILKSFEELSSISASLKEIFAPVIESLKKGSLSDFYRDLFSFSRIDQEYLCAFINDRNETGSTRAITNEQWNLMKQFAGLYHGDSSVLAPLYLNCVKLMPSQALYIPAGVLHAYISGFGAELMTSSDNVLRGGLTPKHVNINELMNILHFFPYYPNIISPPDFSVHDKSSGQWFNFDTPCGEFLLAFMRGFKESVFQGLTPAICVVTEGELMVNGMCFKKGQSFFIPKDLSGGREPYIFEGDFSLYAACSAKAA